MMHSTFLWNNKTVAFAAGESIAAALHAAGIKLFGSDALGTDTRYFCGIGACQCCLVRAEGRIVEACLTPARQGLHVESMEFCHDGL